MDPLQRKLFVPRHKKIIIEPPPHFFLTPSNFFFEVPKLKKLIYDITVASIDVLQSCSAHSFCQINFTLFRHKFTFVVIYPPILGK